MVVNIKSFTSLEKIVKKLAFKHVETIKTANLNFNTCENSVPIDEKDVTRIFKIVDEYTLTENSLHIKKGVEELLKCSENIFKTNPNNFLMPTSSASAPLNPPIYDLLLEIFCNTSQLERQYYFHKLAECYYNHLQITKSVVTKEEFEDQIKQYLPYIKMEMILFYSKIKLINKPKLLEAISELIEVILYPKILREECYKIVSNKLGTENYEFLKYDLNFIEERPGFLGDYYKLNIFVKYQDSEDIIRCFAKYMPTTNETTILLAKFTFKKEIFFYNDFIPTIEALGEKGLTDFLPKCYLCKSNDYIILEDLSYHNYTSASIFVPAEYDWLILVIKQMAKIHACSFVFEEKTSKKMGKKIRLDEVYKPFLTEYLFSETNPTGGVILNGTRLVDTYFLEKFVDSNSLEDVRTKTTKAFKKMYKDIEVSDIYRNVICHGDMWGSNILTKYNKNVPVSCRLVDYQMIRYCSPIVELLFLIQINTNQTIRNKFYQKFLDTYFSELNDCLKRHDINIDEIYDYNTFLKACSYYKLSVICMVLTYIQVVFIPKEIMVEINGNVEKARQYLQDGDRADVLDNAMKHDIFASKIQETMEEFLDELKKSTSL